MRMKPFQIKQLSLKVLHTLRAKGLLHVTKSETEALTRMEEIFTADLKVEDELNREADRILEQYAAKMGGNIDRQKMHQMIKKQLIKDRNLVI